MCSKVVSDLYEQESAFCCAIPPLLHLSSSPTSAAAAAAPLLQVALHTPFSQGNAGIPNLSPREASFENEQFLSPEEDSRSVSLSSHVPHPPFDQSGSSFSMHRLSSSSGGGSSPACLRDSNGPRNKMS